MSDNTPAKQDNAPVIEPVKTQANFWEVVTDILDNPFIQPCKRDTALLAMGYKVVSSVITF